MGRKRGERPTFYCYPFSERDSESDCGMCGSVAVIMRRSFLQNENRYLAVMFLGEGDERTSRRVILCLNRDTFCLLCPQGSDFWIRWGDWNWSNGDAGAVSWEVQGRWTLAYTEFYGKDFSALYIIMRVLLIHGEFVWIGIDWCWK